MANLEQNRQELFDFSPEEARAMDANMPLANSQEAINSLNPGIELDINEKFDEVCKKLRTGTEDEKEIIKLKLLLSLAKKDINMDSENVTIAVEKIDGKDKIILTEEYKDGDLSGLSICTLISTGGKRYCESQRVTL